MPAEHIHALQVQSLETQIRKQQQVLTEKEEYVRGLEDHMSASKATGQQQTQQLIDSKLLITQLTSEVAHLSSKLVQQRSALEQQHKDESTLASELGKLQEENVMLQQSHLAVKAQHEAVLAAKEQVAGQLQEMQALVQEKDLAVSDMCAQLAQATGALAAQQATVQSLEHQVSMPCRCNKETHLIATYVSEQGARQMLWLSDLHQAMLQALLC